VGPYIRAVGKLILLFTVVPFVELYLLLLLGRLMGFFPTVGLVLLTGLVGAALARTEGLRVVRQWQQDLAQGRVPEEGVLGGLLVLVGGVLLITPGVLTDVVGFLLLFPSTRMVLVDILRRRLERQVREGNLHVWTSTRGPGAGPWPPDSGIIDVEGEDVTDEHRDAGDERPDGATPPRELGGGDGR
jgi:UPF0716 protein FxsA